MTPKEKAADILDDFVILVGESVQIDVVKKCALVAIDLRLQGNFLFTSIEYGDESSEYWQQVKNNIDDL